MDVSHGVAGRLVFRARAVENEVLDYLFIKTSFIGLGRIVCRYSLFNIGIFIMLTFLWKANSASFNHIDYERISIAIQIVSVYSNGCIHHYHQ